jgi:hypothetical protein
MSWLFRRREEPAPPRLPHARPMTLEPPDDLDDLGGPEIADVFTCTTCGRTDLPEAGDWDPPICAECDAALNFDAITLELDEDV